MSDSNHEHPELYSHPRLRTDRAGGNSSSVGMDTTSVTSYCTPVSPQKKRLMRARLECAEMLDELLEERWQQGDAIYSNRAIAERLCDIDERTVRSWRNGNKPFPLAALFCLPTDFSEELVEKILSARRELAGDRRSVLALQRAVSRCDTYATHAVLSTTERGLFAKVLKQAIEQLTLIAESVEGDI